MYLLLNVTEKFLHCNAGFFWNPLSVVLGLLAECSFCKQFEKKGARGLQQTQKQSEHIKATLYQKTHREHEKPLISVTKFCDSYLVKWLIHIIPSYLVYFINYKGKKGLNQAESRDSQYGLSSVQYSPMSFSCLYFFCSLSL